MSSIQERLQLKRVPLDTWNIREQLCLASAVVRSGDQNWMSVSRALKTVGEPNRPQDWYSQKSCAAQYGALLEHVETPKRKKRSSDGAAETPQESIVKKLTQERIVEIQKTVAEMNQQYEQLNNVINEVRNQATTEDRLREIWTNIETAQRTKERENARRAALMKEREERRARADRTWRPPASTPTSPVPTPTATPSSPLLTSLLKSSPVVTTPQHMPHPASVVDTVSPSVTAPTLSMLLEKSNTQTVVSHERAKSNDSNESNKHAAIEHIKSQLVQIEQQLKANSSPPPPLPAPAVDIDDIEIKAEDVYAFRDIDLHLPVAINKGSRPNEKPPVKKVEEETIEVETVDPTEEIKEEQISVEEVDDVTIDVEEETVEETVIEETPEIALKPATSAATFNVKFPHPEIKVVEETPHEEKIKEEAPKEPEAEVVVSPPEPEPEVEEIVEEETVEIVEQEIISEEPSEEPVLVEEPAPEPVESPVCQTIETETLSSDPDTQDIPLPPEPQPIVEVVSEPTAEPEEPPPEPDVAQPSPEVDDTASNDNVSTIEETTTSNIEDLKKDDDSEDSIPLKQMIRDESIRNIELPPEQILEPHTETDDDTPMEVSREEEKDGKKRRDYSRKKKADSRTCSGSESAAEASAPESPHASDADRQHRLWKKSVMLVYNRLCAHKYASLFTRPISDEEAPGYSTVVKRPMDLSTIRRNIDNGQIRNTAEFQRDVLLMLSNALLYNSSEHSVYTMAKEMQEEAATQLGILLSAQAHAGLVEAPPRRKRRRQDEPRAHAKRT